LSNTAEGRVSRGVELSAITIASTEVLALAKEVFRLRKHVPFIEYKFDDALSERDTPPDQV